MKLMLCDGWLSDSPSTYVTVMLARKLIKISALCTYASVMSVKIELLMKLVDLIVHLLRSYGGS